MTNQELNHYGVLGMKWGKRKDGASSGYRSNQARKAKKHTSRAENQTALAVLRKGRNAGSLGKADVDDSYTKDMEAHAARSTKRAKIADTRSKQSYTKDAKNARVKAYRETADKAGDVNLKTWKTMSNVLDAERALGRTPSARYKNLKANTPEAIAYKKAIDDYTKAGIIADKLHSDMNTQFQTIGKNWTDSFITNLTYKEND